MTKRIEGSGDENEDLWEIYVPNTLVKGWFWRSLSLGSENGQNKAPKLNATLFVEKLLGEQARLRAGPGRAQAGTVIILL